MAYTPTATATIWKVSTSDTVNTPSSADHEVTISTCPGDFTPVWPCEYQAQYTGATMTTQASATAPIYACKLVVGTKYYMNVRQVVKGSTGVNSCLIATGLRDSHTGPNLTLTRSSHQRTARADSARAVPI